MQVVRKAWTERERWNFDGKYYRVEGGNVLPRPFQHPYPPFYFGGASEAAQAVGAEEADVYLLWGEPPSMVAERIADMRRRAADDRTHAALRLARTRRRARDRRRSVGRRRVADRGHP